MPEGRRAEGVEPWAATVMGGDRGWRLSAGGGEVRGGLTQPQILRGSSVVAALRWQVWLLKARAAGGALR